MITDIILLFPYFLSICILMDVLITYLHNFVKFIMERVIHSIYCVKALITINFTSKQTTDSFHSSSLRKSSCRIKTHNLCKLSHLFSDLKSFISYPSFKVSYALLIFLISPNKLEYFCTKLSASPRIASNGFIRRS